KVAITLSLSCTSRALTCCNNNGGTKGSSPCILTTISCSAQPLIAATSAKRSVPDACSLLVITTSKPASVQTLAIASSSVAIHISSEKSANCAFSATHSIIGLP